MAKAQGIIGNFKGKVGNMVGYQLTDSNNKQTQGIRIYQPNVKNPKTSAQAEQRAKLAPINATYRALKMIIDRGNEGLPYGNKSRLAWLKQAFKATTMPWFKKGDVINMPVGCQLTKGSLPGVSFSATEDGLTIACSSVTAETVVNTIGKVSEALLAGYPALKAGDQITLVVAGPRNEAFDATVTSFVIDTADATAISGFTAASEQILFEVAGVGGCGAVIVSREGANGEHLRSTSFLDIDDGLATDAPYDDASKTAAIKSYMASGVANTDWAEESID